MTNEKGKEATKRSHETFENDGDPPVIKSPKLVPSITKGVSVRRKPRVGEEYQALLPPMQNSEKSSFSAN